MASSTQTFRRKIHEKVEPLPTVVFTLDWVEDLPLEGEEGYEPDREPELIRSDIFHATKPTNERLFLIAAMVGDEDSGAPGEAAAVLDIFKAALPEKEYSVLRERLKDVDDDVNLEMLRDVTAWLMGEWSNFPTKPSSASSVSQGSTGGRSTGRVRGQGSTH